jgi:hypothetical protein
MGNTCKKILNELDTKIINKKIIAPCRHAEATYKCRNITPKDYWEFQEECALFWKHLFITSHRMREDVIEYSEALQRATDYIERAFHKIGGMRYAFFKAQTETFNSIKFYISNLLIEEIINAHVNCILTTYVDPTNYSQILELMKDYVDMFDVKLNNPADINWLVQNYRVVFQAHAKRHGQLEIDREIGAIVGE